MRTFLETWRLIRVVNCLTAMFGVWIGAHLTDQPLAHYGPYVAGLATFLVCAAGNVVNDLVDLKIDRVNRPRRVLVRGALSRGFAVGLAIGFNIIAVILAATVGWELITIVLLAIGLLLFYNFRLKRLPLIGNATVAILGGMTFIAGGLAAAPDKIWSLPGPLIPAVFAVLFHVVREIVKDVEDIAGDRLAGVSTLPQKVGARGAIALAGFLFLMLAGLTLVPVAEGWFGPRYEIIALYFIDIPLLGLLICLWLRPERRLLRLTSAILKVGMLLGIVALLVA